MQPTQCTICFESSVSYSALSCGHRFCNSCFIPYITHKIESAEVLWLRCPYIDDEPPTPLPLPRVGLPRVPAPVAPPGITWAAHRKNIYVSIET